MGTANPFDDNFDPDDQPTFDEGPDEDIIPFEDTPAPLPKQMWACTGVESHKLKRVGDPHPLPLNSSPDQPTTDGSGRYMAGACTACNDRTIWKEAKLA